MVTGRRSSLALVTVALAACHGGPAATTDGPTTTTGEPAGFEWLDAAAPNESTASRVSGDGTYVVGSFGIPDAQGHALEGTRQAYRWSRASGVVALGALPALPLSDAAAMCADGSIVYGNATDAAGSSRAFVWTQSDGVAPLDGLDVVTDTNQDASVSIGRAAAVLTILSGGAGQALFATPPPSADANAVSADGSTVVGRMTMTGPPQKDVAFVWTATGVQTIAGPTLYTDARDVSADGTTVVGFFSDGTAPTAGANPFRGFVWTAAVGAKEIGPFLPSACDGAADVVVGNTQNPAHAYVWTAVDGTRELSAELASAGVALGGATLDTANDVSADGRIVVGQGTAADGKRHAFRAVLPR